MSLRVSRKSSLRSFSAAIGRSLGWICRRTTLLCADSSSFARRPPKVLRMSFAYVPSKPAASRRLGQALSGAPTQVIADRPVGEKQRATLTAQHHDFNAAAEKSFGVVGLTELTRRDQVVPGNAEGLFQNLLRRFDHGETTPTC